MKNKDGDVIPLTRLQRVTNYTNQPGHESGVTPAQRRRIEHKAARRPKAMREVKHERQRREMAARAKANIKAALENLWRR